MVNTKIGQVEEISPNYPSTSNRVDTWVEKPKLSHANFV